MRILGMVLALGLAAGAAQSATLTFDGNICSGASCSNGNSIDQTYGDIAGQIDVEYDANRSTAALDDLYFWTTGYETLTNVAYGTSGAGGLSIVINALAGFNVALSSFDIAPYINRSRNTLVQIIDLATNTLLVDDVYTPLSTAGVTSYNAGWASTVGLQINLGPDAWDVAIDNVVYSATTASPVPLPAALPLFLVALGGLGVASRRRKNA